MKIRKPRPLTRRLMWALAFILAFLIIWRKLRIVIFVNVSLWGLIAFFVGLAVVIYLIFDVALG